MVLVNAAGCDRLSTHFTITHLIKFKTRIIPSAVKNKKWCQAKIFSICRRFIRHFLLTFYWPLFIMKRMLRLVSNLWSISVMPPQGGISLTNNIFSSDNNWNGCEYTCTKSNLFVEYKSFKIWKVTEQETVVGTRC